MNNNNVIRLVHRGTGGQQGWIYSINGIAPTMPYSQYKDPIKIVVERNNDESDNNK